MVDKVDIERVNQLYTEYQLINAAIENFDLGGQIVQMTVSPGPNALPPSSPMFQLRMSVSVPTTFIGYPATMVDAIKAAFTARIGAINDALAGLGVTGVGQPAVPQAGPAARK